MTATIVNMTTNRRKRHRERTGKRPSSPLRWKAMFLSDPSHGWLKVPSTILYLYGLENEISHFSYVSPTGKHVYLEEDSDAGKLLDAIKLAGDSIDVTSRRPTNNPSHVRNYDRYKRWIDA